MAYQVISQNNTTTTLADENGNIIRVPARVSLATSTDYTITKVNNSTATLEDGNGNIIRDVPCVAVLFGGEGGGGGTVDYSKTVQKTNTMPTADATNAGQVFMYTGATDSNYTQNYIYKNVKSATYTGTVSFEAASLSGTIVACSGDNFANFLTESGVEPLSVVSGTMTFDSASELWALVGKDSDGNTVLTFQEYQQDFVDAGFTFTGTPQNGDVVAFTCTVEEASATYTWTRVDVQPTPEALPDQTGHSGQFLTTDGSSASWAGALPLTGGELSGALEITKSVSGKWLGLRTTESWSSSGCYVILGGANVGAKRYAETQLNVGPTSQYAPFGAGGFFDYYYDYTNSNARIARFFAGGNSVNITELGGPIDKWTTIYVTKINNGADITVPAVAGSMAVQVSTVPTADSTLEGQIYQYIGTTDANYTNGYFYKCVSDGADPATYSWEEVSMGGGGSSYTAGTGIDITNGTISVKPTVVVNNEPDYPQYNIAIADSAIAANNGVAIGFTASDNGGAAIGSNCTATNGFAGGVTCKSTGEGGVAIGRYCGVTADNAIQLGSFDQLTNNSDANTFKVGNANGNFEMMSADGTIPAARHAALPAADGTYTLQLVIANGVPTLSWVAV